MVNFHLEIGETVFSFNFLGSLCAGHICSKCGSRQPCNRHGRTIEVLTKAVHPGFTVSLGFEFHLFSLYYEKGGRKSAEAATVESLSVPHQPLYAAEHCYLEIVKSQHPMHTIGLGSSKHEDPKQNVGNKKK
jgi:hypothetical protein